MIDQERLMTFTVILILVIFVGQSGAQLNCYVCSKCSDPFTSYAMGVSLSSQCRFCKTVFTYDERMVKFHIEKMCGQVNETCMHRFDAWQNETMEEDCCSTDLCNSSHTLSNSLSLQLFSIFITCLSIFTIKLVI
ncbi:unnamed protein product [Trichobilharzia szidati]|nr:unnamed protein product [Trichobilharzia szidati]CAH8872159.1 unnamed protein product [Trichobilharzia szidati]